MLNPDADLKPWSYSMTTVSADSHVTLSKWVWFPVVFIYSARHLYHSRMMGRICCRDQRLTVHLQYHVWPFLLTLSHMKICTVLPYNRALFLQPNKTYLSADVVTVSNIMFKKKAPQAVGEELNGNTPHIKSVPLTMNIHNVIRGDGEES